MGRMWMALAPAMAGVLIVSGGCANRAADGGLPPPTTGWDSTGPGPAPLGQGPILYDSNAPLTQVPSASPAPAPAAAAPAPQGPVDPWPRDVTLSNADALIYQPQVDSWKGNALNWRVAV